MGVIYKPQKCKTQNSIYVGLIFKRVCIKINAYSIRRGELVAAMSCSSSGEATEVGIGPMQSQGSMLSWSQLSYGKLSVKRECSKLTST